MAEVVCVRVVWNHQALPKAPSAFRDIHIGPEPGAPFGRKGQALAGAWRQLGKKADGMLILDADVAVDPADFRTMMHAIGEEPDVAHTAPVRIWPVSTHRAGWVWAHWDKKASQELDYEARYFSFCFTYLPRRLITAAVRRGLNGWEFPSVDSSVSATARAAGIPCRVVWTCRPVHMHY